MRKVVIYCANGYGERVLFALDEEDYQVVAITDSNPKLWGWNLDGYTVIPPSQLNSIDFDLLIISTSEFADEIRNDLIHKFQIDAHKIFVFEPREQGVAWEEERIIILKKCITTIKERNIPGNMAELGVWKGEFSKIFNRFLPEKKLYLFDTFEGFAVDKDKVQKEDENAFKDTSIDLVLSKMKTPENCIIKKGWFPKTTEGVEDDFCLVSLDADLYEPIYAGLEYFYPRLVKGGYILVHDYNNFHYKGVKEAVNEFCKKYEIGFVPIVDRSFSIIITK